MGNLQGSVADLPGLLAENGAQQPLLRGQLRLALGGHLTHQDIPRMHLCADANDSSVVQVLQGIIAHAGHIPGNLLGSQLGIPGFRFVLLYMDGGIYIILNQSLA